MFEPGKSEIALLVHESNVHRVRRLVAQFVWLENGKPRNFSDGYLDNPKDLDLSDLEISAYSSFVHSPELIYREKMVVKAGNLKRMTKTLHKVERGLAKLEAEFGPARTFGDTVARVAKVFGIKEILFYADPAHIAGNYDDNRYQQRTPAAAINRINEMADAMTETASVYA